MKLKKLEITGFKSFVDKTAIEFSKGISAIVGPNGCGKSNIVDALCWVMGEQSVKQLRGKNMEDVIFSGTHGKPALNMAEVSLTLINDNGSAPEELRDYSEIMLTRRLYRSGESAYLLNKQPCRLKDINNVFLGSGIGAKSYSLIQQGNVGAITEAGPEERRYFIEEAAGITRYKNRKTEALRKVDATQQNLLRVKDIVSEISRQMSSLQRQAKKAELYKNFQEKIQFLDISLAEHRYNELTVTISNTGGLLQSLTDKDEQHSARLSKIDAAIEGMKLKRQEKAQKISEQKSLFFETRRDIDKIESEMDFLRKEVAGLAEELKGFETAHESLSRKNADIVSEMASVESESKEIQSEVNGVQSQIDQEKLASQEIRSQIDKFNQLLEGAKAELLRLVAEEARCQNIAQNAFQNKESLKRRLRKTDEEAYTAEKQVDGLEKLAADAKALLETLKNESAEVKQQIEGVRADLTEKSAALSAKVKGIQSLEMEKNRTESRYSALKKMQDSFQWYKDGVKAVMQQFNARPAGTGNHEDNVSRGILGLIADILEPEPSFETAVEAVLGDSLQYIITKDQQAGLDAIAFLEEKKAGRSGFVPVSAIVPLDCEQWTKPDPEKRLLNHVTVKPGYETVAEALLGHVVVAESLEDAVRMYKNGGPYQTLVSKNGNILSHQGVIIGGSKDNLGGILTKKSEIKELKEQITVLEQKILLDQDQFNHLETLVRACEISLQKCIAHQHDLEKNEMDGEKDLYRKTEELKHAKRRLDILRLEQEQLMGEELDIEEKISLYNKTLSEIQDRVKTSQEDVGRFSRKIETVSEDLESFNHRIQDLKLKLTSYNANMENNTSTLRRLKEFHEDGRHRLETLEQDIRQKKQREEGARNQLNTAGPRLAVLYEAMKSLERELEAIETDYQAIDEELKSNDSMVSGIKNEREETLKKIRLIEVELSQLKIRRDNISGRLGERYNRSLSQLKAEMEDQAELKAFYGSMEVSQLESALNDFRSKIEKITDVNLGAIKEYEELKQRFEFLEEQQNDLQTAIDNLHRVIRKINQITQERFVKTFNAINEKLETVFPRLFNGGSAKLVMTDDSNPLETGVEFMVHPPGKKLTRLSLLSGGEKALSAISFIFSIFLIKQTSFCLMDEIDAPLDDANVFRFNDLLKIIREKSQIIMITHNKKSMEIADSLYGITMEKQGISKIVSVNFEK
ncbi:MAG: chromosome segregation protein SMC [Proteobacteria bacterium]|nr:chromosome segregation protein SMC [Pseudomonadota bacterium]MBU4470406.1 chromosome segregation protein SMC [Pseudomonadota bacterium]MCG2753941.1 chromosome segregation protein SMC [Desulfobacteraceae bacterium]